jgi:hypothetical protein
MKISDVILAAFSKRKAKKVARYHYYKPDPSHNSIQKSYYLLYHSARNSLTDKEMTQACKNLLSLSPESIFTDIDMDLRAERILSHDNIPAGVFEEVITKLEPAVLVNPHNGVSYRLLLNHSLSIENYRRILHRTGHDQTLMKNLLTSTEKALKNAGHLLTYKIVFVFFKQVTTSNKVTWNTHKKDQKMYLVLLKGLALVEDQLRDSRL